MLTQSSPHRHHVTWPWFMSYRIKRTSPTHRKLIRCLPTFSRNRACWLLRAREERVHTEPGEGIPQSDRCHNQLQLDLLRSPDFPDASSRRKSGTVTERLHYLGTVRIRQEGRCRHRSCRSTTSPLPPREGTRPAIGIARQCAPSRRHESPQDTWWERGAGAEPGDREALWVMGASFRLPSQSSPSSRQPICTRDSRRQYFLSMTIMVVKRKCSLSTSFSAMSKGPDY